MKFQAVFLISFVCFLAVSAEDKPTTQEKVCEPGKEFTKGCNDCTCNPEGTGFSCKEISNCPQTPNVPQVEPAKEETCTPGEVYKVKCNECRCPESGIKAEAACTIIGCPDE